MTKAKKMKICRAYANDYLENTGDNWTEWHKKRLTEIMYLLYDLAITADQGWLERYANNLNSKGKAKL